MNMWKGYLYCQKWYMKRLGVGLKGGTSLYNFFTRPPPTPVVLLVPSPASWWNAWQVLRRFYKELLRGRLYSPSRVVIQSQVIPSISIKQPWCQWCLIFGSLLPSTEINRLFCRLKVISYLCVSALASIYSQSRSESIIWSSEKSNQRGLGLGGGFGEVNK